MASKKFIVFILFINLSEIFGSAIPMWEFLSRAEKMTHLYTTFAKQVSDYCKTNDDARLQSITQCKRDLLSYGLDRLQTFSDISLDSMDPYQKGANELIWEIMMNGHPIVKTDVKSSQLSSTSSSSAVILGHTGGSVISNNNNNNYYQKNPIFDNIDSSESSSSSPSSSYAMDMDIEYGYSNNNNNKNNEQEPINQIKNQDNNKKIISISGINFSNNDDHDINDDNDDSFDKYNTDTISLLSLQNQNQPITYLTGPMVVRVRPDGTPVEEDKNKPLPSDDDRELMQYSQINLSTAQKILNHFNNNNGGFNIKKQLKNNDNNFS